MIIINRLTKQGKYEIKLKLLVIWRKMNSENSGEI
jgi:hypothetical protein